MALLARDALVSIAHRRAAALNYQLQGHNYAAIGKHLGVTANAVQKDVVKALRWS
jgi:DNA-directed RNA polymerase specialized sigma24 family protein